MIGIDANILAYARVASASRHERAKAWLRSMDARQDVVLAELVLTELYLVLRSPAILAEPLDAPSAAAEIQRWRRHPRWMLVENATVMTEVWRRAAEAGFARRRLFDVRLALTLQAVGVTEFATANLADFRDLGFERVFDPTS